jgi:hypothetical protein
LVIGIIGTAGWLVAVRFVIGSHFTIPNWFSIAWFLGGGLVGAIAAIHALVRGSGRTRLLGIAGLLLGLVMTLLGLAVLELTVNPTQILGIGNFD